MTRGRAQQRRFTIGTGPSRPTGWRSSRTPAPTGGSARSCIPDHPDDAGPVRSREGRGGREDRGHHDHPAGRDRGAGQAEATAAVERAMELLNQPRSAWIPPRCGGATCCRRPPSRTRARSARSSTAGTTSPRWTRRWTRRIYAGLREDRPRGGSAAKWSARDRRGQLRRGHRHGRRRGKPAGGERYRRGPPDGSATILTGTSPHGRVTRPRGPCWPASDELGIPVDRDHAEVGRHRPDPRGRWHGGSRSLQHGGAAVQQASVELIELARARAAARSRPAPPTWSSTPGAARSQWPATRRRRCRWPGWPTASGCGADRVLRARGHVPVRDAVAVVEVDTETGKVTCAGW